MPTNIWNTYGIRTCPFFQEELDLSKRSLGPIDLFVGRSCGTSPRLRSNTWLGSRSWMGSSSGSPTP